MSGLGEKSRVLVVDDDETLRSTLVRVLARAGYDCVQAPDGEVAAQMLAATGGAPIHLVISDIHMPGMTGIDLLREVRRYDADLPVILLTAGASVETAIEAVHYGALRYLTKPFDADVLLGAVERATCLGRLARVKREALALLGRDQLVGDRAGLDACFGRALDELWMAFQPIVSWSTREVFAYEALVRSRARDLGSPAALFDAAERLDRLSDLSRRIRGVTARAATEAATAPLLFINLHPRDLLDESLLAATDPLAPLAARVVFEVTERVSLDDIPDATAKVAGLRARGFRVALDDLGAGYAGLTSFAQLLPDFVKLDMSLVRGIDQHAAKQRLVASMIAVCRDLGMDLIAEGVETAAERDTLVALGANLLQGYLFAKPGPPFPAVAW